eukprot:6200596-Pleurochrysis_carterae.AAC.1
MRPSVLHDMNTYMQAQYVHMDCMFSMQACKGASRSIGLSINPSTPRSLNPKLACLLSGSHPRLLALALSLVRARSPALLPSACLLFDPCSRSHSLLLSCHSLFPSTGRLLIHEFVCLLVCSSPLLLFCLLDFCSRFLSRSFAGSLPGSLASVLFDFLLTLLLSLSLFRFFALSP